MVDSPLEHPFPCEIKHRITENKIERAVQDSKCSADHLHLPCAWKVSKLEKINTELTTYIHCFFGL